MYVYCVYPAMSKKSGKLVRFKQKGQKQASFLAFHKCCQGCLLRGPRYISTSFILVCALRCTQLQGARKVYSQAEKFIRLLRIKQKFIRIAYLYSKWCTDCRINLKYWSILHPHFSAELALHNILFSVYGVLRTISSLFFFYQPLYCLSFFFYCF